MPKKRVTYEQIYCLLRNFDFRSETFKVNVPPLDLISAWRIQCLQQTEADSLSWGPHSLVPTTSRRCPQDSVQTDSSLVKSAELMPHVTHSSYYEPTGLILTTAHHLEA